MLMFLANDILRLHVFVSTHTQRIVLVANCKAQVKWLHDIDSSCLPATLAPVKKRYLEYLVSTAKQA